MEEPPRDRSIASVAVRLLELRWEIGFEIGFESTKFGCVVVIVVVAVVRAVVVVVGGLTPITLRSFLTLMLLLMLLSMPLMLLSRPSLASLA